MSFLILLLCGTLSAAAAAEPQKAVVIVPVADVWSRPLAPGEKPSDEMRETQVLFGEYVLVHASSGPWVRIEAVEQPEFTHHDKWEGYPGWIRQEFIATNVRARHVIPENLPILQAAQNAIGTPYLWGGLSPILNFKIYTVPSPNDLVSRGYDCSGLVHVAYRKHKMRIPRDSHEQWMKAKPIKRSGLKPADLIFSAKADNPKKITHVALYAGERQIIEAPQTGMVVRKISFRGKYGKALDAVESGDTVGERVIYFGTYLPQ